MTMSKMTNNPYRPQSVGSCIEPVSSPSVSEPRQKTHNFSKLFSNDGHKRAALRNYFGNANVFAKTGVSDSNPTTMRLITPPPSLHIQDSMLGLDAEDVSPRHWALNQDEEVQYKPFVPKKPKSGSRLSLSYAYASLSPKRNSTKKRRSRRSGTHKMKFFPRAENTSADSNANSIENGTVDGAKDHETEDMDCSFEQNWLKRSLSSASSRFTNKLKSRSRGQETDISICHSSTCHKVDDDVKSREERQEEQEENEEEEEKSFVFNTCKTSFADRSYPIDEEFNAFENLFYYGEPDGNAENFDEHAPVKTANQSIKVSKTDDGTITLESCANPKLSGEEHTVCGKDVERVENSRSRKPIIDQSRFSVDENDTTSTAPISNGANVKGDADETKTSSPSSSSSCSLGPGGMEKADEYTEASEKLTHDVNDSIVIAKQKSAKNQGVQSIQTKDPTSSISPLPKSALKDTSGKLLIKQRSQSANAAVATKPLVRRFNVIDTSVPKQEVGLAGNGDDEVKRSIKGKPMTRRQSLLEQFAENIINSNRTISDYCRLSSVFMNDNPNYFEEHKDYLKNRDEAYDVNGPGFIEELQTMFSSTGLPKTTVKGEGFATNDPVRNVVFVPTEHDGVEIQEYDTLNPPSATIRSKSAGTSRAVQKEGVSGNDPPLSSNAMAEVIDGDTSITTTPCSSQYSDTSSVSDVYSCGPVPFPDSSTRHLLNGLLELLGAPEEVRETDDLKAALLSLHPYLSKAIGFLWNVSKIGMEETALCKKRYKEISEKATYHEVAVQFLHQKMESLKDVHEEKVRSMQSKITALEADLAHYKAYRDAKVAIVDMNFQTTNDVLCKLIERSNVDHQQDLESFKETWYNTIDNLNLAKENLLSTLTELNNLKSKVKSVEIQQDEYRSMERECNDFRALGGIYDKITKSVYDKQMKYKNLKDKLRAAQEQISMKDTQILSLKREHEEQIEELSKLTPEKRQRTLGFWDRTHYEAVLLERDDMIDQLQTELQLSDQTIHRLDRNLRGTESLLKECKAYRNKVISENCLLKIRASEVTFANKIKTEKMEHDYKAEIHDLSNTLQQRTKYFEREIQIHKTNCQKSVSEALKVALKSEISLSVSSNPKRFAASKALSYLMNKKRNLKKCLEILSVEKIPMNDKYLTWESIPKCKSYRKKKPESRELVSIKNPDHFIVNPGPQDNGMGLKDCTNSKDNGELSPRMNHVRVDVQKRVVDVPSENVPELTSDSACTSSSSSGCDPKGEDALPNAIQELSARPFRVDRLDNDRVHYPNRNYDMAVAADDKPTNVNQAHVSHSQFFDKIGLHRHTVLSNNASKIEKDQNELNLTTFLGKPHDSNEQFEQPLHLHLVESQEGSVQQKDSNYLSNPIFEDPIGSYGKSSGARFIRDKLRSSTSLHDMKSLTASRARSPSVIDSNDAEYNSNDSTRQSKPAITKFGENITNMFSTVVSTFSKKPSGFQMESSEHMEHDSEVLDRKAPTGVDSLEVSPISPLNFGQVSVSESLSPRTSLAMRASGNASVVQTAATPLTAATSSTKSGWFDFANKESGWYSFEFTNTKETNRGEN
ncbi:unnamed protein product [Kluyveromyces dobzhanskii CBS 2104]|uniref:WGS project CCBQ000000000 data, contig 00012 n=1 Tax=Kluyveromyces dobzhanskii CBS 2104 TaxID=1427455 RepID=A0A0A8L319_9SACH|nr:unnamed protein product [Kluyveromyces dobzhanskii CBS 2104]